MMHFRIADTFTDSLARLDGDQQKAVKTTAFDLQLNPANPGLRFHKLDRAKDKDFWSVRVNDDIRLIVHKTSGSLLLCYVGHHDKAYDWAERRKLDVHPTTGAAQFVEIRERIEEIIVPTFVANEHAPAPKPPLFASQTDDEILAVGVPVEWIDVVRSATEDTVLEIAEHLPQEAAEALLDLATVGYVRARVVPKPADPFQHPDAQRRFRVVADAEELGRALEYPWDRWTVFLHPAQRGSVERQYNGPARVSGSAGTGKTIVALHRAVFLARSNPDARILLATFSDPLANALQIRLRRLIGNQPRLGERIEVHALDAIAQRLYERTFGKPKLVAPAELRSMVATASVDSGVERYSPEFLLSEWGQIVDAWQLSSWESYRDVERLGRKTRLPEAQRAKLWTVFNRVRQALAGPGMITRAGMYARLADHYSISEARPFDFVVIDESQDLSVPQLRFLAAFGTGGQNPLFFAGDLGQRIFQPAFSWRQLGVDIRGRSSTLRVNYRTSHQIRRVADRLLDDAIADVDGNEERRDAVSVFNGPAPEIAIAESAEEEIDSVANWLGQRVSDGVTLGEIGVFVRSEAQLPRARAAVEKAGVRFKVLDDRVQAVSGSASIGTMHLAKGLEFRTVIVMACDDEVLPLQSRIETVTEDSDLEEVYKTERHLLYVACTRARDHLLVSAVRPASEFLDDLSSAS